MSGLAAVSKLFPFLPQIQVDELMAWAPVGTQAEGLDNYYANRLLYPYVSPVSEKTYHWDQVILKAAIARNKDAFYSIHTKRLQIPPEMTEVIPDLIQLTEVFNDVCKPQGVSYVSIKPDVIGTIITPRLINAKGMIILTVAGNRYEIAVGTLGRLAIPTRKVDLHFISTAALLMEKPEFQMEVAGGPLGILIDARLPAIKTK